MSALTLIGCDTRAASSFGVLSSKPWPRSEDVTAVLLDCAGIARVLGWARRPWSSRSPRALETRSMGQKPNFPRAA